MGTGGAFLTSLCAVDRDGGDGHQRPIPSSAESEELVVTPVWTTSLFIASPFLWEYPNNSMEEESPLLCDGTLCEDLEGDCAIPDEYRREAQHIDVDVLAFLNLKRAKPLTSDLWYGEWE